MCLGSFRQHNITLVQNETLMARLFHVGKQWTLLTLYKTKLNGALLWGRKTSQNVTTFALRTLKCARLSTEDWHWNILKKIEKYVFVSFLSEVHTFKFEMFCFWFFKWRLLLFYILTNTFMPGATILNILPNFRRFHWKFKQSFKSFSFFLIKKVIDNIWIIYKSKWHILLKCVICFPDVVYWGWLWWFFCFSSANFYLWNCFLTMVTLFFFLQMKTNV